MSTVCVASTERQTPPTDRTNVGEGKQFCQFSFFRPIFNRHKKVPFFWYGTVRLGLAWLGWLVELGWDLVFVVCEARVKAVVTSLCFSMLLLLIVIVLVLVAAVVVWWLFCALFIWHFLS